VLICAWCGTRIAADARPAGVSHGICAACALSNFPDLADPDTGPEPALTTKS
jgi:hypothetical protein